MKNITKYFILLWAIFFVIGCTLDCNEKEPYLKNMKWNTKKGMISLYDSLNNFSRDFSFVYEKGDVKRDTIWFQVRTIGFLSNKDRYYRIKQVIPQPDTSKPVINPETGQPVPQKPKPMVARPGIDYLPFDDPEYIKLLKISPNSTSGKLPIIIYRSDTLKTLPSGIQLIFTLEKDNDFNLGYANKLSGLVTMYDVLVKPSLWNGLVNWIFGPYSMTKLKFMIDHSDEKWDDSYWAELGVQSYYTCDQQFLQAQSRKFQHILDKINSERVARGEGILRDENGKGIYFQIDY